MILKVKNKHNGVIYISGWIAYLAFKAEDEEFTRIEDIRGISHLVSLTILDFENKLSRAMTGRQTFLDLVSYMV